MSLGASPSASLLAPPVRWLRPWFIGVRLVFMGGVLTSRNSCRHGRLRPGCNEPEGVREPLD